MDSDFKRAEEEARRAYSADVWSNLLPQERIEAIYRELRKIDMARVRPPFVAGHQIPDASVHDHENPQSPPTPAIFGVVASSVVVLPADADSTGKDEAKIRALEDEFVAAVIAKDVNAIMSLYVADETLVVFDASPPRQCMDAKAYRNDREKFFAAFNGPVEFEMNALKVATDGALGFGHCIQHVGGTNSGGRPIDLTLRVTDVYRKYKENWLIVHEHVSVSVDLDAGRPDLSSMP
jgi:ketosteroid isomerase-like protein